MEDLLKLYDDYAKLKIKENDLKTIFKVDLRERDKQEKIKYDKKILKPPTSIFKNILDLVNLPYYLYSTELSEKLRHLLLEFLPNFNIN